MRGRWGVWRCLLGVILEAWGLDRGLDRGKRRQHAGGSTQLPLSERKAEQRKAEEDSVQDLIEDGRRRK